MALADPACLSVDEKSGYLWSQKDQSRVVSALLGQTTVYSSSGSTIRQISVIPFTHRWHRLTAVLGKVYAEPLSSWRGVSFGTNNYGSNGFATPGKRGREEQGCLDERAALEFIPTSSGSFFSPGHQSNLVRFHPKRFRRTSEWNPSGSGKSLRKAMTSPVTTHPCRQTLPAKNKYVSSWQA